MHVACQSLWNRIAVLFQRYTSSKRVDELVVAIPRVVHLTKRPSFDRPQSEGTNDIS